MAVIIDIFKSAICPCCCCIQTIIMCSNNAPVIIKILNAVATTINSNVTIAKTYRAIVCKSI